MLQLSNLAAGLGGSVIREMYNEALTIEDTISFTVGEPDFVTAPPIIQTACKAWEAGLTHYTPNAGIPELRRAIAEYHKEDLAPNPDTQVMISCGATEGLQMALFTLVNPGDEVLLISPAWPNYFGQIAMCGAVAKLVPAYEGNDFVPDPADIKKAISPKTKAIIVNSPSNPTGAVIGPEIYREILEILMAHDIYIIADEVYGKLVYNREGCTSICSFPQLQERVVYINSFSKMFAMTGWRLGYAISTPEIIRNMVKLHENGVSCLPAPGQLAAAEALMHQSHEIMRMRDIYEKRRNLICQRIAEVPKMSCRVPKGAFYVFANIQESGLSSREYCIRLLKDTGVVSVPGSGFGQAGEGYVRFTYATAEQQIHEGFNRIQKFAESL